MKNRKRKVNESPQAGKHAYILERTNLDLHQPEAGLWDQPVFNPASCANKHDFRVVAGLEFAGNRQRRNHVSAGASTGNENSHNQLEFTGVRRLARVCAGVVISNDYGIMNWSGMRFPHPNSRQNAWPFWTK